MAIAIILLLCILNGLFSMSEIALVSSKRVLLREAAEAGSVNAKAALRLAESPSRFLSTVQVGITSIGIISGMYGEAALSSELAELIRDAGGPSEQAHRIASVVVVVTITYLSLVVGELVPKRLAMSNPEKIAYVVARPMTWLAECAGPVVRFLSFSTDLLFGMFGSRGADRQRITEKEIRGMIRYAAESGIIDENEHDMVENVFRFGDLTARGVMVPRTEIQWLEESASIDDIKALLSMAHFSHYPICRGSLDNLLGVVLARDLLKLSISEKRIDLGASIRPALFVPESLRAPMLVDMLRNHPTKIAFVVDEHGGIDGLVTITDIARALVGEIGISGAPAEDHEKRRADGSWLISGTLPISRLKELMGEDELPLEIEAGFLTAAGFVQSHLGRIPTVGERFSWGGHSFEILDLDGPRIDKILVIPRARHGS